MRSLLAALLVSLPAAAQISGSLTASGAGHLTLDLQCELACSPVTFSAGEIDSRFSALDGGETFVVQPELDGGHFEFDAPITQQGTALTFTTTASCACGAIDSGTIALSSAPFPIAPTISITGTVVANREFPVHVQGFPQGTETIAVAYSGAGIDGGVTITHAGADFTGGNTVLILKAPMVGELDISATLLPYAVTTSESVQVNPLDLVDPDHSTPGKSGCSTAPELLLLSVLALARRMKRARRP